jgi:ribosomal protein S18 acetylase RimI-like enzyme
MPASWSFRPAQVDDAAQLAELVNLAYEPYVSRLGRPPGPMTEDYTEVIRDRRVIVAESGDAVVGLIVLDTTDEGFLLHNIAVAPSHQGTGVGRALLQLAEAEAVRAGYDSIYLYTHVLMTENQAMYARAGYVQYDVRGEGNFTRVYLRKLLL